jgi:hypothetical protein
MCGDSVAGGVDPSSELAGSVICIIKLSKLQTCTCDLLPLTHTHTCMLPDTLQIDVSAIARWFAGRFARRLPEVKYMSRDM